MSQIVIKKQKLNVSLKYFILINNDYKYFAFLLKVIKKELKNHFWQNICNSNL